MRQKTITAALAPAFLAAACLAILASIATPSQAACEGTRSKTSFFGFPFLRLHAESCNEGDRFTVQGRCKGPACGNTEFGISREGNSMVGGAFLGGLGGLFVMEEDPDGSVRFGVMVDDGYGGTQTLHGGIRLHGGAHDGDDHE